MHRLRRRSERHHCYRAAKIKLRAGDRAHDCLLIDMSDGGVRLNIEGLEVPDEFVLLVPNGGNVQEGAYKVVWRFGNELGAKSVSGVRRLGIAERDLVRAGSFRY
jgi:PilZ domain